MIMYINLIVIESRLVIAKNHNKNNEYIRYFTYKSLNLEETFVHNFIALLINNYERISFHNYDYIFMCAYTNTLYC